MNANEINQAVEAAKLQKRFFKKNETILAKSFRFLCSLSGCFLGISISFFILPDILSFFSGPDPVLFGFYPFACGFLIVGAFMGLLAYAAHKEKEVVLKCFEVEYPNEAGILKEVESLKKALEK